MSAVLGVTAQAFQYESVEQQAWSAPSDLEAAIEEQLKAMRRLYPMLRLAKWFSPSLRSLLHGFLYENNGCAVGAAMTARLFKAPYFELGNVGVIPNYRKRGIAHELVKACIDDVRQLGGKFIHLNVIEGNDPAIALYQRLEFQSYSGTTEMSYHRLDDEPPSVPINFPNGYHIRTIGFNDWRPRYELSKRITPEAIQAFCPIIPEQFMWLSALKWLAPLFYRWSQSRVVNLVLENENGQIIGTADLSIQYSNSAANTLKMSIDPDYAKLTPAFLKHCIGLFQEASPERTILTSVERWQSWVVDAAFDCGFSVDYHQLRMGIWLE